MVRRTVALPPIDPLLADVLAVALLQMGIAALPPRRPDLAAIVLAEAGLLDDPKALFAADDLADWQPCLLTLRLFPSGEDLQLAALPAKGDAASAQHASPCAVAQ